MPTLREVTTRFNFVTNQAALNRVNAGIQGAIASAKGLIGILAGGALLRGFASFTKGADETAKFSKATGLAVESIQEFQAAANLSGASSEEFNKGLLKLNKSARDASRGLKTQIDAFGAIGISARELRGLQDPEQRLLRVADAFKNLPPGANRSALAMDLLGRAGAKLVPFLNEGSAGIAKLREQFRKTGGVFSAKQAAQAEKFNDAMLLLRSAFKGLRNQLALAILPALTDVIRGFNRWIRTGNNAKRLLFAIRAIATAVAFSLGLMVGSKILGGISSMVRGIGQLVVSMRTLGTASLFASAKLALIPLAIIAIGLIIEDIVRFARGEDSVLGRILGKGETAKEIRDALIALGKLFIVLVKEVGGAARDLFKELSPELKALGKELKPLLPFLIKGFVLLLKLSINGLRGLIGFAITSIRALRTAFGAISSFFRGAFAGIRSAWDAVVDGISSSLEPFQEAWAGAVLFVASIFAGLKRFWDKIVSGIKAAVNAVGAVFKAVGEVILNVWNRILNVMNKIKNAFTGTIEKAKGILNRIGGFIIGSSPTSGSVGSPSAALTGLVSPVSVPSVSRGRSVSQTNTATANVAQVNVNIQGNSNMDQAQIRAAAAEGVQEALQDLVTSTARNFRPVAF